MDLYVCVCVCVVLAKEEVEEQNRKRRRVLLVESVFESSHQCHLSFSSLFFFLFRLLSFAILVRLIAILVSDREPAKSRFALVDEASQSHMAAQP